MLTALTQRLFQHRSGRVIAISRLVLALVFLLAIGVDPAQPARYGGYAFPLAESYILISAALILATWNNWWLDFRLARPAHVLDIAFFTLSVYFTEAFTSNFTSPFFAFFTFLLFSSTIRWGWHGTVVTALAAVALYAVIGFAGLYAEVQEFDPYRFGRRVTYLVVLSFLVVWFGINWQGRSANLVRSVELDSVIQSGEPPIASAAQYAQRVTGADRIIIAWWDHEEPWTDIAILDKNGFRTERYGPQLAGHLVDPPLSGDAFLLDLKRERVLARTSDRKAKLMAIGAPLDESFATRLAIGRGMVIPVASASYQGYVFALEIPGLCCDDLTVGNRIGQEISRALERASTIAFSQEAASTRTRLSLARDLHDSVIQLLAGTAFRLEGIKRGAKAGREIGDEIETLQHELSAEQRELRAFIEELRGERGPSKSTGLCDSLRQLLARMERQWTIECELVRCPETLQTTTEMEHTVQQLVREGIANAVRHGKASRASISVDFGDNGVSLIIEDNGSGFSIERDTEEGAAVISKRRPWSLNERVHERGGSLSLYSNPAGSRIIISLPFEGKS